MDDLISRQDAIDEVVAWLKDRMSDKKNGKPLTERLKDLPSAQSNLQPTCNKLATDTISRQAALDVILPYCPDDDGTCSKSGDDLRNLLDDIENLPSAQPDQRWISSGEKPPEEGSYLVWMPFAPPKHRMAVAEYFGGYWNIKTPISAWMPLPEPYKEGEG